MTTKISENFDSLSSNKLADEMVQLHVKRGDDSQFLLTTTVDAPVEIVIQQIAAIYSGRLKVDRLCSGEAACLVAPLLSHCPVVCEFTPAAAAL